MAFFNKARGILHHTLRKHTSNKISASTPSIFQAIRCMSSKLFVGGLSYQTDETSLTQAFEKYGEVVEARIIVDRETGNSRGFGFVTFQDTEAASAAIMALDGKDFQGRAIRVNHAHDRARAVGGGYGNYRGGTLDGGHGDAGYVGGGYGGGGNYNSNFDANHGVQSSGGGYGAPGDSYTSGGSVGTYANGRGAYGGGSSYSSVAGAYGGGSSYSSVAGAYGGNNFESRNVGFDGGNNQNFGVANGGGVTDNYFVDNSNAGSGLTSIGGEFTSIGGN